MMKLVRLTSSCPEQYEAFSDGKCVGYIRLRHGHFYVECPDVGGERVYDTQLDHIYGEFANEGERKFYLEQAVFAICEWDGMSVQKWEIEE